MEGAYYSRRDGHCKKWLPRWPKVNVESHMGWLRSLLLLPPKKPGSLNGTRVLDPMGESGVSDLGKTTGPAIKIRLEMGNEDVWENNIITIGIRWLSARLAKLDRLQGLNRIATAWETRLSDLRGVILLRHRKARQHKCLDVNL